MGRSLQEDVPGLRKAPVYGADEECPVCNCGNDIMQEDNLDWKHCFNFMSLNEAKWGHREGREIL